MDSLKDAYELLEHTAKGDLLSEKLWKSNKVQSLKNFFVNRSRNNEFFLYRDTQSETYDCVADLMSDFIRQYPAPPICRQKLWDSCNRWLKRIACELNISNERPLHQLLQRRQGHLLLHHLRQPPDHRRGYAPGKSGRRQAGPLSAGAGRADCHAELTHNTSTKGAAAQDSTLCSSTFL